jgi:hypothetical protein
VFQQDEVVFVEINAVIAGEAARMRVLYNLQLPDALQVAAALTLRLNDVTLRLKVKALRLNAVTLRLNAVTLRLNAVTLRLNVVTLCRVCIVDLQRSQFSPLNHEKHPHPARRL